MMMRWRCWAAAARASVHFSFEDARSDDDLVIERDGAAVLVDSTSLELLKGSSSTMSRKWSALVPGRQPERHLVPAAATPSA